VELCGALQNLGCSWLSTYGAKHYADPSDLTDPSEKQQPKPQIRVQSHPSK
jgi:hypothetical protein